MIEGKEYMRKSKRSGTSVGGEGCIRQVRRHKRGDFIEKNC